MLGHIAAPKCRKSASLFVLTQPAHLATGRDTKHTGPKHKDRKGKSKLLTTQTPRPLDTCFKEAYISAHTRALPGFLIFDSQITDYNLIWDRQLSTEYECDSSISNEF